MLKGLHQRHYKNAIINVLEAWGGKARAKEVIDALMNGPPEFRIELSSEEKAETDLSGTNVFKHACHAAVEQLRKDGYIEKVVPSKRGIWIRTNKPYAPSSY